MDVMKEVLGKRTCRKISSFSYCRKRIQSPCLFSGEGRRPWQFIEATAQEVRPHRRLVEGMNGKIP
ncbi:MAG: hypothetical protein MZV70_02285 [Desulfobacterales bacterium]|nr:hypothetical protein [Desulfobacterales bacterium]